MKALHLILALTCVLPLSADEHLRRIAFGSCFKQGREGKIFTAIDAAQPQLFIWLGDNIYGDSDNVDELADGWKELANHPDYKPFSEKYPVIATWDDHDYGKNDAGKEFPIKVGAQKAFLDWLEVPHESARRQREGVYSVQDYGPADKLTRIILLDTRYHRDAIGSDGTILGAAQWEWLEKQLRDSPAQVNIIGTSIQMLADGHRFEKWANFPKERQKLMNLLAEDGVPPVILLSGDRHLAEISMTDELGYPLYDITSSSLNLPFGGKSKEENQHRVGENYRGANYGTIGIDWFASDPIVTLCICDTFGAPQRAVTYMLKR